MAMMDRSVYFGIDINEKYTMISYFQPNMDSPDTISTVMGAENYQIPTCLAKRKGMGQWFYGEQAKKQVSLGNAIFVDDLYNKFFSDQEILVEKDTYFGKDLLVIFLKQVLSILGQNPASIPVKRIIITIPKVSIEHAETLSLAVNKLGIDSRKLTVIDYNESFFYYVLNQPNEIFLHDVFLFDYSNRDIKCYRMKKNINSRPQVVNITESNYDLLGDNRDASFSTIIDKAFAGKVVSCVYLVGNGFEGDWMKESLQKLCKNRRIFKGNNLYSKGACYSGIVKDSNNVWPYVYIGDNELKVNVSLKVIDGKELKFHNLISAGNNWYETKGEVEVILESGNEVEVWLHRPESRDAKVELLELTDLPNRESRTTRLRILAKPLSDSEISIVITDLGFGDIVPSSKKSWTHTISIN